MIPDDSNPICRPIDDWIVCISGWLQSRGQTVQGIPSLYHRLYQRHRNRANVIFQEWNSDWNSIAEWIFRLSRNNGHTPRIMIVSYSWGAGFGFTRLAKFLGHRGLFVDGAVLSDAVFHFGPRWTHGWGLAQAAAYWPFRLPLLSDCPRPVIDVPDNVRCENLHWYIQSNSRLRGHELVQNGHPCPNRHDVDFVTHSNMDDLDAFRTQAIQLSDQLFRSDFDNNL
jgi:pimeloyl-ACP methyl ester carboxylesterase